MVTDIIKLLLDERSWPQNCVLKQEREQWNTDG